MHYVLSPMSGVPSAYSLFNSMFSPPTKTAVAFEELTNNDKDDHGDEQPPLLDPIVSTAATTGNGMHIPIPSPSMAVSTASTADPALLPMTSSTSRLHNRRYSSGRPQASPKSPHQFAHQSANNRDWSAAPRSPGHQHAGDGRPLAKRRPNFDARLDMVTSRAPITPSRLRPRGVVSTGRGGSRHPPATTAVLDGALADQHSPTPAELAASEVGVLPLNPRAVP